MVLSFAGSKFTALRAGGQRGNVVTDDSNAIGHSCVTPLYSTALLNGELCVWQAGMGVLEVFKTAVAYI